MRNRKRSKTLLLIGICLLAIGFAGVSSMLIINGKVHVGPGANDFDIYFTEALLNGQDMSETLIDQSDFKTINFETPELNEINQQCILDYTIKNDSKTYDATISTIVNFASNPYIDVINEMSEANIPAGETRKGKLIIFTKNTPMSSLVMDLSITFNINAITKANDGNTVDNVYTLNGFYKPNSTLAFVPMRNSATASAVVANVDRPTIVKTDANGYFSITGLKSGNYDVYYVPNGSISETSTVEEIEQAAYTHAVFSTNNGLKIIFEDETEVIDPSVGDDEREKYTFIGYYTPNKTIAIVDGDVVKLAKTDHLGRFEVSGLVDKYYNMYVVDENEVNESSTKEEVVASSISTAVVAISSKEQTIFTDDSKMEYKFYVEDDKKDQLYKLTGTYEPNKTIAVVTSDGVLIAKTDNEGYFVVRPFKIGKYDIYEVNNNITENPTEAQVINAQVTSGIFTTDVKKEITFANNEKITNVKILPDSEESSYVVVLNPDGGVVDTNIVTVTLNHKYGTLPVPTKEGYTFLGWFLDETEITSSSVVTEQTSHTLIAKWQEVEKEELKVSFDVQGAEATLEDIEVVYDETYGTLPVPTRIGYEFKGWYLDNAFENVVTATTKVSENKNHTLYAKWIPSKYTVTLDAQDGTLEQTTLTVEFGETYSLPTPTKEGYKFEGWYYADDTIVKATDVHNIASDITLTAKYSIKTYSITLNPNNGIDTATTKEVTKDEAYGTLPTPTWVGHEFLGWFLGEDEITSETIVETNEAHTLIGKWAESIYVVTLDTKGGVVSNATYDIKYGQEYVLPTPVKEGYTFVEWCYPDSSPVSASDKHSVEADITLEAKYVSNSYKIEYELNGGDYGDPSPKGGRYGESVTVAHPTKTFTINVSNGATGATIGAAVSKPLTFIGWSITGIEGLSTTTEYSNLTSVDGDTVNFTANYQNDVTNIPTISKTGYTCHWVDADDDSKTYESGEDYSIDGNRSTTLSLEAECTVEQRSLVINLGTGIEKAYYKIGNGEYTLYTEPVDVDFGSTVKYYVVADAGYDADSCSSDGDDCGDTMPDGGLTFNPTATLKKYDLTFTLNTGVSKVHYIINDGAEAEYTGSAVKVSHGSTVSYYADASDGYEVTCTSEHPCGNETMTGDKDYEVSASPKKYTITFDGNGGTPSANSKEVTYLTAYGELATATRTGYAFAGWFTDGDVQIVGTETYNITGNQTLYAHWIESEAYYTVNCWLQKIDASDEHNTTNYTKLTPVQVPSTTGTTLTVDADDVTGFETPESEFITVDAESTVVVNFYYKRKAYDVNITTSEKGFASVTGDGKYAYEKDVNITYTLVDGYSFDGIEGDKTTLSFQMPASAVNMKLKAKPNQYLLTINSGTGVNEVYYKIGDGSFELYTEPVDVDFDSEIAYYVTPSTGYHTSTCNSDTASCDAGKITTDGLTINATVTPNTYNIIYSPTKAGVSGTTTVSTHTYGVSQNLSQCGFSLTGYEFKGWSNTENGSVDYNDEAPVTSLTSEDEGEVILYAVWEPISYSIKFNSNSGTGTMANLPMVYDEAKNLTANAFTRGGYHFVGWITDLEHTTADYADEEEVNNLTQEKNAIVNLSALWHPNIFKIQYDANGGTGTMSDTTCTYGAYCSLAASDFTKTGYEITSWNSEADGSGTRYELLQDVTSLLESGTTTIYAQWSAIEYDIEYDLADPYVGMGQNASISGQKVKYDTTETFTLVEPVKNGYTFTGWKVTVDCTSQPEGSCSTTIPGVDTTDPIKTLVIPVGTTGNISVKAYWTLSLDASQVGYTNENYDQIETVEDALNYIYEQMN